MIKRYKISVIFILMISPFLIYCSAAHKMFPNKDIPSSELNEPTLNKKVPVASRSSEFKQAVNAKLRDAFKDWPVYVKFIGLGNLKNEDV